MNCYLCHWRYLHFSCYFVVVTIIVVTSKARFSLRQWTLSPSLIDKFVGTIKGLSSNLIAVDEYEYQKNLIFIALVNRPTKLVFFYFGKVERIKYASSNSCSHTCHMEQYFTFVFKVVIWKKCAKRSYLKSGNS